ncbi:hypothetical protein OBBRIDRAFT_742729 [Obba rivulosa]|uniref:Uncharacterized protein n=1 Tax=Obba rivulosa TaxID=1052685 RepID=A0A8E2ANB8_9APHY|nr:hypothetical protein OBBRIDRAFT_742729 [Obba rivulosa]
MESDLDQWRNEDTTPGQLRRIQDGQIWQTLSGPDGHPFFDNSDDRPNSSELRVGISIGFDGQVFLFSFQRSAFSGSHSTGVLSVSIANLDTHLRYRVENVLLCGLTPGPRELSGDELQKFICEFVTDLLRLYEHGLLVRTPQYPNGRLVRVALVCISCDHPALCRMAGFGDHSMNSCMCTKCELPHDMLFEEAGLTINSRPTRSTQEHLRRAQEYKTLNGKKEREQFFKKHASRWFEFSRLPYFDPVRMAIIDPMHNILLGVVKTQWCDVWIQGKTLRGRTATKKVPRELDEIHEILANFEMPRWVARLPSDVGYPAGGSLTSDEWKAMVLVYCLIVIPLIWEEWGPASDKEYQEQLKKLKPSASTQSSSRSQHGKLNKKSKTSQDQPQPRMHPQDADNFLTLAAALKIILARTIDVSELERAQDLLQAYLLKYREVSETSN